jgi:hypothetical protein
MSQARRKLESINCDSKFLVPPNSKEIASSVGTTIENGIAEISPSSGHS